MQEQDSQGPSPETDHGHDRKRKRKVLSCTDCRRRKVQCDRNLPACGRCTKADKASSCVYEDEPPSAFGNTNGSQHPTANSTSRQPYGQSSVTVSKEIWDDILSRLLQQERTIERIRNERTDVIISGGTKPNMLETTRNGIVDEKDQRDLPKETMLFRGQAFRTQFHGPTDARSSLTHVPEAFEYTRDIYMKSPALVRFRRELRTLRELKKTITKDEEASAPRDLLSYLPERDRANAMIELYLESIDQTYGVIHVPSFRRDYESFWAAPRSGHPETLVTILLMIACVECLFDNNFPLYMADSPMPREKASQVVRACEPWLAQQSQKHTTLAYFQIHCLLVIAKEMNGIKLKRRWVDSGNLLRIAVSSGLHRDTNLLQKQTSAFDKEMRRRIWSFIVEVDIQSSLDRGMPAVALEYSSDCGLPSNLNDEDFDETVATIPPSRPSTELTKMSYMRFSAESRSLRSRLTRLMNQPQPTLSYEDFLACTQEIEQSLARLPEWPGTESPGRRPALSLEQGIALLRIQLEQFLLVVHAFAARTAASEVGVSFSKTVFLTTSKSIIRKLTELAVTGRRFLLLYRQDIIRIFVSIGFLGIAPTNTSIALDAEICRSWLELADGALGLFEDRIMRSGNMQWTFSFAIYDILNRQLPMSTTPKETMSGADRVYRLVKYILENQDPSFAMKAATHEERPPSPIPLQGSAATSLDIGLQTPSAADGSRQQPTPNEGQVLFGNTTTELLDWNFDDWMLYNDAFWQQSLPGADPI